ncbi:malate/lactate/ureidoglycolate dehydrogenase [Vogesella indigofera]|uniref:Malate/lactate/ureidoglycolate dehydrogenase n=1 Tax=Vogesella indigofera TaxID=45465 RepID=A0ABT5I5C0_VOGIN|nr:malate/lactate/ureidoglycolate dehydrogenase [Vogesella indigofera]MDC7691381.1 malate/lactate/ureidoglycolate dehydrogenase [Vogesella indigofera]
MLIPAERLHRLAHATLCALGSTADEASVVADHLLAANLKGHDSHGVGMLPFYVYSVAAGTLQPNQPAWLLNDCGAILQFDGERGYGQRVVREAMDAAIERVGHSGIVLLTVRNSHHMGRIGSYGEQAAAAGKVALFFVNVTDFPQPLVAPFGGSAPRFGTNPLCIAFPAGHREPAFILDFATSMVAYGKTRVAYLAGQHFDEAVMLDAAGQPTADPAAMHEAPSGALRPIAAHKGGGLVAAIEFLAGLLSGGGTLQPGNAREGGIVNNLTAILIDPEAVSDLDWLRAEYDAMAAYIRSSPPPPGQPPVLLAGEPERQREAQRLAAGVEISDNEWAAIVAAARRAGVIDADQ